MSLINDVLRDLEKRERAAPTAVQVAFGQAPTTGRHLTLLWRSLAWLSLLLCALALLWALFWTLLWWLRLPPEQPATPAVAQLNIAPKAATSANLLPPLPTASAVHAEGQPTPQPQPQSQPVLRPEPQPAPEPQPVPEPRLALQPAGQPEPTVTPPARQPEVATPSPATTLPSVPAPTAAPTQPVPAAQMAGTAARNPPSGIQIRRVNAPPAASTATSPTNLASLEQVQRDLDRGLVRQAELQLHNLLQVQPEHGQARLLLARIYLHQNRSPDAVQLLQSATGQTRSGTGQIQSATGQTPQPDFDLLLAASLRETGQHAQAADLYQRLTRQYPGSQQALLGLALSQDAAGQWLAATGSYRMLLDSPDPRTVQLASQRLQIVQQRAWRANSPALTQPSTSEEASNP